MKKSKLTLGISVAAMSCALLAGCNEVTYSPEGYLLTYKDANGNEVHYSAQDLFGDYVTDSTKVSTMFDSIYKLIVRNYFNSDSHKGDYEQIKKNAENDVEGVKSKAKENQETNDSKYDKEWEALLESYGCKDEEELLEHFIYERELKEFNEQFYKNHIADLRDNTLAENSYSGYLEKKVPYHVRHILVKVDDSGSTNYWNGTITKDNATDFYDVANALAEGKDSFGKIAQQYSKDDGSKVKFGELDIVDKDTEYVPEFKLGMYVFENLFNAKTTTAAATSSISINGAISTNYQKAVTGEDTPDLKDVLGQIPYGAFSLLKEFEDVTKDELNRDVHDGDSKYFPRNIIFNNYLNNHYLSVITKENVKKPGSSDDWSKVDFTDLDGFTFEDKNGDGLNTLLGKDILRTKDGQPILVARAGTSSYQGVHFIVIERSGLQPVKDEVSLSEYYTTYRPSQGEYPKKDGQPKQTYVNYLAQSEAEYKTRAETVENKIKNFDPSLNKHIYQLNVAEQKIKFTEEGKAIGEAIDKWIATTNAKSAYDDKLSWEKTWESYIESLKVENVESSKRISNTCAIGFTSKDKDDAEWYQVGGACYDNKVH